MLRHSRSVLKYAQYFAVRHSKVTEDAKALEVVLTLDDEEEEERPTQSTDQPSDSTAQQPATRPPRRGMSIRTHFATVPTGQQQDGSSARNNAGRGLASRIASMRQRERLDLEHQGPYTAYRPYEMGDLQQVNEGI